MFETLGMATVREHWEGTTQWNQPVHIKLIHADVWPGYAWRVQWGPPGNVSGRKVFEGLTMEADARAFLATKMAELGTDWKPVEARHG